jgi:REP element-mobilizing transposase RayT
MTKPKFKGKYRVESIRLPNRDYSANGWYFITICTHQRQHFFGDVVNGQMYYSPIGEIAQKYWSDIPNHFDFVYLDVYVIMPNHIHGIIVINRTNPCRDVACYVSTDRSPMSDISPDPGSLGAIVRSHKSAVTRWCNKNGHNYFKWQPRFYEHIIRADGSLNRIRQYIINNPSKWTGDRLYTTNRLTPLIPPTPL